MVTFLLCGPVTVGLGLLGAYIDALGGTYPFSTLICGGIGCFFCGLVLASMVGGIVSLVGGSVRSVVNYVRQRVVDEEKGASNKPPRAQGVLVAADAEEL